MKLLVVTPHLSTGGGPQYLLKYIETFRDKYSEIKLVEFTNFSSKYVVQKNKVIDLLGKKNVFTLGDYGDWSDEELFLTRRNYLIDIVQDYEPDVIYMSDFPECYEYKLPPDSVMNYIYSSDRKYKIIETTHNNSFDFNNKRYIPDEFLFCSSLHIEKSEHIDVPKTVWDYPIEFHERPNREEMLRSLGLNPTYLHILNVGLLSHNKNQKYIFELAKTFLHKRVEFYFIGNACFLDNSGVTKEMQSQPNCKILGERNDVEKFMSCMDIFLFPSKKELNPIVIKEALSWGMDVIANEDENYTYQYKDYSNFNLVQDINVVDFINDKYKSILLDDGISHNSLDEDEYLFSKNEIELSHYSEIFEVEDGDIVVDVGACIGAFSLAIIQKDFKTCYSIEPSKLHLKDLKNNIGHDGRYTIINKAISDKRERKLVKFGVGPNREEEIDIITFKECMEEYDIDKVDFLKMDIEGYEYNIVFHKESYDWIKNNVNKFVGELHLVWNGNYIDDGSHDKSDLTRFINKIQEDFILDIRSADCHDITDSFINNYFLVDVEKSAWDYYQEVLFYAKNKKHIKQNQDIEKKIDGKFLLVCSFYNNTREHILQTFDNIINQTYKNWLLIVGDDFSDNNCRDVLKEEVKKINHPNILYYDVKFRRELYLYQNLFKAINYDYYFDLDSDDVLDKNILKSYSQHFEKYPNVFSIFSDYDVVDENEARQRFSAVKNREGKDYVKEFYDRTNSTYYGIWSKYHSWNMFGHARCFRKSKYNNFLMDKKCKSSTDSIVLFNSLREGNHLNIPRNMYRLINRSGSDSDEMSASEASNFNHNAIFAINKYSEDRVGNALSVYDDVWLETNALSMSMVAKNNHDINLISNVNDEGMEKIRFIYSDKNIYFNIPGKNNLVIVWNGLNNEQKEKIMELAGNRSLTFSIYYFLDDFGVLESGIKEYFENSSLEFFNFINKYVRGYSYFNYFRHIVVDMER